ncbi:MAG: hypothetical protein ACFB16_01680 [Phormidesmis sp.]
MISARSKKSRSKKSQKRLFSGMDYREVQRSNASRRGQLPKRDRDLLKAQGYRNLGWDDVIQLYQKLNELELQLEPTVDTLEDLFLKADRIGRKYQTREEIDDFNRQLTTEVGAIADIVDQQFPNSESEFVDYSHRQARSKTAFKRKRR